MSATPEEERSSNYATMRAKTTPSTRGNSGFFVRLFCNIPRLFAALSVWLCVYACACMTAAPQEERYKTRARNYEVLRRSTWINNPPSRGDVGGGKQTNSTHCLHSFNPRFFTPELKLEMSKFGFRVSKLKLQMSKIGFNRGKLKRRTLEFGFISCRTKPWIGEFSLGTQKLGRAKPNLSHLETQCSDQKPKL